MEKERVGSDHDLIGDQILEEHRRLAAILREIEECTDLVGLLAQLEILIPLLRDHHAAEESSDGLPSLIADRHPAHTARLMQILSEHDPLRAQVESLRARVAECLEQACAPMLHEARELATLLRDHEHRESELLTDAIFTDFGGGD